MNQPIPTRPLLHGAAFLLLACSGPLAAGEAKPDKPAKTAPPKSAGPVAAGANGTSTEASEETNQQARRLFAIAMAKIADREIQAGAAMLNKLVDEFPTSPVRFLAWLEIGKLHLKPKEGAKDGAKAIDAFRHLLDIERPDGSVPVDLREAYLEALYLTGSVYFEQRQFSACFPPLRKITSSYPNSVWANQSYYFIGMAHYQQGNWPAAIEHLSLVGTFVDPASPLTEYVEAGRRFYIKVQDADMPIERRLGRKAKVVAETASGDREELTLVPLAEKEGLYLASIPTEVRQPAPAQRGDSVLQVIGGDRITVRYSDSNTKDGQKDVVRERTVKVVSTGSVAITLGDWERRAEVAFIGQPVFLVLNDVDLDSSPKADSVRIKVVSRYQDDNDDTPVAPIDPFAAAAAKSEKGESGDDKRWRVRDETQIELAESALPPAAKAGDPAGGAAAAGAAPGAETTVHSGRFLGQLSLRKAVKGETVERKNNVLTCDVGDEIVVTYIDEEHAGGKAQRQVTASVKVAGELKVGADLTNPRPDDPALAANKNLVEAQAFLEMARIFKNMGLSRQCSEKAAEGLAKTREVLREERKLPNSTLELAYRVTWDLYLAQGELGKAIAACRDYSLAFPNSGFADQALLGIAKALKAKRDYVQATEVLNQILALPRGFSKAEAQYLLALLAEEQGTTDQTRKQAMDKAIPLYRLTAERYPDSEFAGEALGKLVVYYRESRDYPQALELLKQIFEDHRDKPWLDARLKDWVLVAWAMGDYQTALAKSQQLIEEYPSRPTAKWARENLPRIDAKIKAAAGGTATEPAAGKADDKTDASPEKSKKKS